MNDFDYSEIEEERKQIRLDALTEVEEIMNEIVRSEDLKRIYDWRTLINLIGYMKQELQKLKEKKE